MKEDILRNMITVTVFVSWNFIPLIYGAITTERFMKFDGYSCSEVSASFKIARWSVLRCLSAGIMNNCDIIEPIPSSMCRCCSNITLQDGAYVFLVGREYGEACVADMQCSAATNFSSCIAGFCDCPSDFVVNLDGTECLKMKMYADPCTIDLQCSAGTNNSACILGICGCPAGFILNLNSTACLEVRSTVGEPCVEESQCTTNMTNTLCDPATSSCQCVVGFTATGNPPLCLPEMSTCGGNLPTPLHLPDNVQVSAPIPGCGTACGPVLDLNVWVNITHTFLNDVSISVRYNNATSAFLRHQDLGNSMCSIPYGLAGVMFDDEGTGGFIQYICPSADFTSPPSYQPNSSLSVFDGVDICGQWTIHGFDEFGGYEGDVHAVKLIFNSVP